VDALAAGLGTPEARVLLAPFFGAGGRVTLGGVHYLVRGDNLMPVAATEFARDPVFGYRSSDLHAWIAERSGGARRAVDHVPVQAIREGGPQAVAQRLADLPPRGVLIVDAIEERDIEVAALGALEAEIGGLHLIARTAASYPRARAGQEPATVLAEEEVVRGAPGLVVVGSHVPTTTTQLRHLLAAPPVPIDAMEIDASALVGSEIARRAIVRSVANRANTALGRGETPIIYTSRIVVRGTSPADDLAIAAAVSRALIAIVRRIIRRPAWVLAKGGITSSDIATRALSMSQARVVGPLLPGVPLWRSDRTARWPGLLYLVFPGNVGDEDALRFAVRSLSGGMEGSEMVRPSRV
jgi:uncharacterized protein YgbK (DUF1537 family)